MHLLWWVIVGLIAGWATGKIMRGSGFGPLMDIVIGIIGAIVGGWIMRAFGFSGQGGTIYTILIAIDLRVPPDNWKSRKYWRRWNSQCRLNIPLEHSYQVKPSA